MLNYTDHLIFLINLILTPVSTNQVDRFSYGYGFITRPTSLLVTYQMNHTTSSANGISSFGLRMSLICAILLCWALFRAHKATMIKKEELELPIHYFITFCCWIFMNGTWIFWNQEARTFVYRKFKNIGEKISELHLIKIRKMAKPTETGICRACRVNDSCPNCIAKSVLKNKRLHRREPRSFDISQDFALPGVV